MKRFDVLPCALLALGLLQIAGDLFDLPQVRALAMATAASPAPKVFSTQAGYEAFSTRFELEVRDRNGNVRVVPITPERYTRVAGAYNRRNAYGAVLAGAPLLRSSSHLAPILDDVATFAVCGEAPLLRELGVDPDTLGSPIRVVYRTRRGVDAPAPLEVPCR